MNIISRKMTGRQWGDKKPFAIIRKFRTDDGVKAVECEADFWEGPTEVGGECGYERIRWIEVAGHHRTFPEPHFAWRKPSTCSFEKQLANSL